MNDFDNKQICLYKDINRLGFTCDVCGRKVNGCRYINGMSFCEKCYQETFGKDNQQNEMQQLKQQLAEKQNTIDEINKEFVQAVHDWKALCAEKDKEIEDMDKDLVFNANEIKRLIQEKKRLKQNQKQLAITELEKVKEKIDCEMAIRECDISEQTADVCVLIADQIDNQIKELKG